MDIELLFLDDLRSEFERVPPALEIEQQLLSGGGEDVNGAVGSARPAGRPAFDPSRRCALPRSREPPERFGDFGLGGLRGRRDLRPQNAIGAGAGLLPSTVAPTVLLST